MVFNLEKNFYCVSSKVETNGELYGCFKIGPFFEYQSLTFANVLRRTLLADQSKNTFSAVQIYGISHEFSSINGVRESVIDLILNLEKIVFQTVQPITKPQIAFIHYQGPGILTAQHIHLPLGWKCLKPKQYIATCEVDGQVVLKLFFSPNFFKFDLSKYSLVQKKIKVCRKLKKKSAIINSVVITNCFSKHLFINLEINIKNSALKKKKIFKNSFLSNLKFQNLKKKIKYKCTNAFFPLNKNFVFQKTGTISKNSLREKKIFQRQKNFLFFNSSRCSIEKVNYTLQTDFPQFLKRKIKNTNFNRFNPRPFRLTHLFFEIWTDGSIQPKTAILKALRQILLDIFSYKKEIINSKSVQFLEEKKLIRFSEEIAEFSNKKNLYEKFVNLEIGNFYLDLETFVFLKKNKIYKIIDFCNFFEKVDRKTLPDNIKTTIDKFYFFVNSVLSKNLS
uniref:Plastid-encoded RNA polymerase subunit alpha n=1 Tax=Boodleopsis sp. FL1161 TaxID=2364084 RepID=A0A386AZ59_9CHLO|nr:RNA polymerase a-subunit [Boodleopsis sp. FL1161]